MIKTQGWVENAQTNIIKERTLVRQWQKGGGVRQYLPLIFVIFIGILGSALIFQIFRGWERSKIKAEFIEVANDRASAIKSAIEKKELILDSIKALYSTHIIVDRNEFHSFVETYFQKPTGIQALQWLKYVRGNESSGHVLIIRWDSLSTRQIVNPWG